jgi:hypothetical protein
VTSAIFFRRCAIECCGDKRKFTGQQKLARTKSIREARSGVNLFDGIVGKNFERAEFLAVALPALIDLHEKAAEKVQD